MPRSLAPMALVLALASSSLADDTITPDVVRAVKQATAYIRVEADDWGKTGSGFVVAADGETVLVVTNHHVAVKRSAGATSPKPATITVVFDGGTKSERSFRAEVVAADAERDLAVLKLTGVKDAPKPIAYANPPAPFETMAVYSFGFPFGQDLAVGKASPAVTVGKASVSSLRAGDDGETATIQIDGNLNPGNSGGPVVDGKGRLVGVAVAILKDGQGIGFLVPVTEVVRTMEGRLGRVRVAARTGTDGRPTVRVETDVIDPTGAIRGATAYYVVVPPKGKKPDSATLDKHPGSKPLALKVGNGVATGEFALEKAEGELAVQVVAERGPGKPQVVTRVRAYPFARGPKSADLAGPAPDGWTNYVTKDKSFAVWLPAKPARQEEGQRNVSVGGETVRVSSVVGKTADGLVYHAESLVLPLAFARATPAQAHLLIRAALLEEKKGRFTESDAIQVGGLHGVQYRIEYADEIARARVFVSLGGVVRIVRVMGTADEVADPEADMILLSFRVPGDTFAAGPSEVAPPGRGETQPAMPKVVARGKEPVIFGTISDKRFKSAGPAGGVLIGLEAKFTKFGDRDIVRAVRPIYRVGDKEEQGPLTGADLTGAVTLKAKDGYAVGGMSAKSDWWCHGFSLTYMKVNPDGTLDPKDSYESDWVGWNGKVEVGRVIGNGTPVVGLVGKIAGRDTTCLGLLFKGEEGFNPDGPARGEPQTLPAGEQPTILGTIRDPEFKTVGPAGAVLVGVEARFEKFGDKDIVRGVRPIYRVGGKEEFGEQFGNDLTGAVTVKAKEGYAVGGISGKSEWWCHGFSLTFMKVKADGTLDPKDSYESDWAGWNGDMKVTKVVGDGPPVVGIVGKIVGPKTTALGLLFKGQEGFEPAGRGR